MKKLLKLIKNGGEEDDIKERIWHYLENLTDEEWNNLYTDFDIQQDGEHGAFVIFGLPGSEVESMEDVANGKHDRNIEPECECVEKDSCGNGCECDCHKGLGGK